MQYKVSWVRDQTCLEKAILKNDLKKRCDLIVFDDFELYKEILYHFMPLF